MTIHDDLLARAKAEASDASPTTWTFRESRLARHVHDLVAVCAAEKARADDLAATLTGARGLVADIIERNEAWAVKALLDLLSECPDTGDQP